MTDSKKEVHVSVMNRDLLRSLDPNASQKNKSITLKCTKYLLLKRLDGKFPNERVCRCYKCSLQLRHLQHGIVTQECNDLNRKSERDYQPRRNKTDLYLTAVVGNVCR
jgi:hypothetical protein